MKAAKIKSKAKRPVEAESELFSLPRVYVGFLAVRIIWTFIGQRGYLHPDEYFQSLEVVTSDLFNVHAHRTWEFQVTNTTKPIRNIAIPYLLYGVPIQVLKSLGAFFITTNNLIMFPRLVQTLLSILGDVFLYKTAKLLKLRVDNCMSLYASSYITLVYLTHTFSNSTETVLFMVLIYFTVKSIKRLEKKETPDFDVSMIGLVTCVGVFNRPTFVIYAFVPLVYLAYQYKNIVRYSLFLLSYSAITAASLVLVDTFYYTMSFDFNNLIITPLNFFLYNINQDNLALHGAHPVYQHVTINCFLLFGLQYLKFFKNFKQNLLLSSTFMFALTVFSLVSHKEARFLLPLLILLCLVTSSESEMFTWYSFNFILAFVYGVYHQGAVTESLDFIQNMFKHEANAAINQHVIYHQTYMPPRYLVNVQVNQATTQNQIYDLMSSMDEPELELFLAETYRNVSKDHAKGNFAFFLVTPSINDKLLCETKRAKFSLLVQFNFNIQFENLKNYADMLLCNYETCNYKCTQMNIFERVFYTFTLNLYQFFV